VLPFLHHGYLFLLLIQLNHIYNLIHRVSGILLKDFKMTEKSLEKLGWRRGGMKRDNNE
jgi:hypothetical protein